MKKDKKILIISASIGTGHMQAAKAIEEYWHRMEPSTEVKHIDFLEKGTLSIDHMVKEFYIKLLDIFPMFYELIYRLTQRERQGEVVQTVVSWMLKNRMAKIIEREKPDVLVFTHPFPCGAAAILKRQKAIDLPMVGVITDFTVHQFWVYPQVDCYCIGSEVMTDRLVASGIPEEKIVVTGMPIRQSYFNRPKRDYSLNEPIRALIMGGGLGLGAMKKVLQELSNTKGISSIDVVTGHNEALYESLSELSQHMDMPVRVHGYTMEIPRLMREASILFTKPGGLTCQEAVAVGLPMIFYSAIPGQEEANAQVFEELECACWVKDLHQLSETVERLLQDPSKLQAMSDASQGLHEDGAANIGKVIHRMFPEEKTANVSASKKHIVEK